MELDKDLFGAYILQRHWFGLSNKRGGLKRQVFMNEDDALKEVRRITRTRAKNGYKQQ